MLKNVDSGSFQAAIEALLAHAKQLEARVAELEKAAKPAVKKAVKKAEDVAEAVKDDAEVAVTGE